VAANNIQAILSEIAPTGKTGTLMLVFADKSLGRFYITGGALATARYKNRQGQSALDAAKDGQVESIKFHENADLVRSSELIDTVVPTQSAPAEIVALAARPAAVDSQQLPHVIRSGLEDLLTEYIGPAASLIMAELPANATIDSAIDQILREISDTQEATNFVRAAQRIVEG